MRTVGLNGIGSTGDQRCTYTLQRDKFAFCEAKGNSVAACVSSQHFDVAQSFVCDKIRPERERKRERQRELLEGYSAAQQDGFRKSYPIAREVWLVRPPSEKWPRIGNTRVLGKEYKLVQPARRSGKGVRSASPPPLPPLTLYKLSYCLAETKDR